jgi:hypothetical protein
MSDVLEGEREERNPCLYEKERGLRRLQGLADLKEPI